MFQILRKSAISKIINKFTSQYCRTNKLAVKETVSSANKRRGKLFSLSASLLNLFKTILK